MPPSDAAARGLAAAPVVPGQSQIAWVDLAKGLGIVLVVVGHAWRGVNQAGLIGDAALFQSIDRIIYAFHMPLFFFLSGLFLEGSIKKSPLLDFARGRIVRLIWPLFLWTWVFFVFRAMGGGAVNTPVEAFPILPLPPQAHFWFLWALFVIHIVLALLRPAFMRVGDRRLFWWVVLGVALGLALLPLSDTAVGPWLNQAAKHLIFVLLGMAATRFAPWDGALRPHGPPLALALVGFGVGMVVAALWLPLPWLVQGPLAGLMVLCFVTLCRWLSDRTAGAEIGIGRWLSFLGRQSLAIYLAHTIFSAGLRVALLALGIQALGVHMILGVAIGLIGPLILVALSNRWRLQKILGLSAG